MCDVSYRCPTEHPVDLPHGVHRCKYCDKRIKDLRCTETSICRNQITVRDSISESDTCIDCGGRNMFYTESVNQVDGWF